MPITVNGPGGVTINFPDGTDPDTINRVMKEATGYKDASGPTPLVHKSRFGTPEQEAAKKRVAEERAANPTMTAVDDTVRGIARGVPVLGGFADEGNAALSAAAHALSGGYLGDTYDNALEYERAKDRAFDQERPVMSTATKLAGGLASAAVMPYFTPVQGAGALPGVANAGLNALLTVPAQGFAEGEGGFGERLANAGRYTATGVPLAAGLGGGVGAITSRLAGTPANSITAQGQNLGVTIPRFMDTGAAGRQIGAKVGALPFVGDDINEAVRVTRQQTGQAANNIADGYAQGAMPQTAGETLSTSLTNFSGRGARAAQDRAYAPIDNIIPQTTVVPLSATQRAVAELERQQTVAANPMHAGAIRQVQDAVQTPNGLTFEGLRRLRTRIGTIMDDALNPDARDQQAGLKMLYGALTDDMNTAITTHGGQRGQQILNRANAVARNVAERREAISKLLGVTGDKSGESVVDRVVAMASTKSTADAARLAQVRRAADADSWREISAAAIQRLGRTSSNEFSPDIFLRNFSQLSPRGAQLLFRSTGQDDLYQALTSLANVSGALQQFNRLGNPSGTGGVTFLISALAGAASGDIGATAGTMIAGRGVGYLMAQPRVVRGMSRYLQAWNTYANGRTGQNAVITAGRMLASEMAKVTGEDPNEIAARLQSFATQQPGAPQAGTQQTQQ